MKKGSKGNSKNSAEWRITEDVLSVQTAAVVAIRKHSASVVLEAIKSIDIKQKSDLMQYIDNSVKHEFNIPSIIGKGSKFTMPMKIATYLQKVFIEEAFPNVLALRYKRNRTHIYYNVKWVESCLNSSTGYDKSVAVIVKKLSSQIQDYQKETKK